MSIRCMTRIWEQSKHKGSQLLLLLAIADFADDNGFAFPGIETLAEKIRMTGRHTLRLVAALEDSGELLVINRRARGNLYIVTIGLSEEQLEQAKSRACKFGADILELESDKLSRDNLSHLSDMEVQESDNLSHLSDMEVQESDIAMSPDPSLTTIEPLPNRHLPPQTAENLPPPSQTAPAKETPLERIARRRAQCNGDPLSLAADCAEAQAASGKPASWTVPPAAGGVNVFADGPLTAFCQLAGIPLASLSEKQCGQWATELAKIAATWEVSASDLGPCIEALSQDDGYNFKCYSTPFNRSFAADVGVMCARVKQGEPLARTRGIGKTATEPAGFDGIREWLAGKQVAGVSGNGGAND